ncbi:MAG: amidohydrolase family protein [Armatimonadota bacterium]
MSEPSTKDAPATLVTADWLLTLDGPPIRCGAVLVVDGRIAQVGREADVPLPPIARVIRIPRCAIIPGLVNCHTHLEHALSPAIGDGVQFQSWLERAYSLQTSSDESSVLQACRAGAAEAIRGGVVAVGHCGVSPAAMDAMSEAGLGGTAFLEVFGIDEGDDLQQRMAELKTRVAAAQRVAGWARVGVSPHSPYTAGPRLIQEADGYARSAGLPVSIHLAEWRGEIDRLLGRDQIYSFSRANYVRWTPPRTTSVRYLQGLGVLRPGVVCAHCVHIDAEEVRLLALSGVGVALCPRSNALHGHGLPPVQEMMEAGTLVGIGTDGAGSVGRPDMFEEMRWLMASERARHRRPDTLVARDVLRMATLGSAMVLGLEPFTGSLRPGKRADLVCVDLPDGVVHERNIEAMVVLCGGPMVRMTMVGGEVLWSAGDADGCGPE